MDGVQITESFGTGQLSKQLKHVAKLIKARDVLEIERAAFFVELSGFDTHTDHGDVTAGLLEETNSALSSFIAEMGHQEVWENVTIVSLSDFARTLTSNGLGTDHAWGGNHFLLGGGIRGGRILGQYPARLLEEHSDVNIGRGRVLPTTSFEHVWAPICKWFGVDDEKIEEVLPNAGNFDVFSVSDIYQ